MAGDEFDDIPLEPQEQLDSDEIRNNDGDDVVDPPERWIEAKDYESLDERLSEETPDVTPDSSGHLPLAGDDPRDADDGSPEVESMSDNDLDHLDPEQHGRERGQIDGTPEDGDSFFVVVD
jgi:hypothetical protein